MLSIAIIAVAGIAAYRWWNENPALAWLAILSAAANWVATVGIASYVRREATYETRNIDEWFSRVWGPLGFMSALAATVLLIASFF